jgi:uncharacterized oxidoreductase
MKLTGNTIFITGGGSGIGRGLAEALHRLGNRVIIGGRRRSQLDAVTAANPGMVGVEIDIADPDSIRHTGARLITEYPELNVLINNAGVMMPDTAEGRIDEGMLTSTVETNLLGSIRMSSTLVEHLKTKPDAALIYNTSVLAFVPLAVTAVYSATKAALHSYVLSQRFALRGTGVRVLEIAPPWVRTELMNSQEAEQAMPLDRFIEGTMAALGTDADEILVEEARPLRANPGPNEHAFIDVLNTQMTALLRGRGTPP